MRWEYAMESEQNPTIHPQRGDDLVPDDLATQPPPPATDTAAFADAPTLAATGGGYAASRWQPPESLPPLPPTPSPSGMGAAPPRRGISRRALLAGAGASMLGAGALAAGLGFYLTHHGAQTGITSIFASDAGQILHLLRRAGFGPAPDDVGTYLSLGVSGAMDRLINYTSVPNDIDSRLAALHLDFSKADDVVRWWVLRMLYSPRPFEEKLTLFWHGVLTSSYTKVGGKRGFPLLIQQNQLLRAHALGRFDDLIHAISIDPAMLIWLDGNKSTGRLPNENYARELMELFTMGLTDQNGKPNYTQNDVHQGALALTGWHIAVDGNSARGLFAPARHYSGSVTYLGHSGPMGLDDVVRLVCAHPSTGWHIAWRMWSFFVAENPTAAQIKPLADAYYRSNHSIKAMVEAMFNAPEFFSPAVYRARVKSPLEFVIGAVRALGFSTSAQGVSRLLAGMGQIPFGPPDVSGWNGDKVSANWVSTGGWMARVNFINQLVAAASGVPTTGAKSGVSVTGSALQRLIATQRITSATALADYFIAAMLDNQLDTSRRAAIHAALNAPASGPTFALAGGTTLPAASVRDALYLVMSMPEYQMN
jgi:uncharacterized protein (DUF1800 family)